MIALLTTIHILTAIVLVLAVLLQSSKGSDVAAAFGGMGSQAAFGPRGTATFLSKATVALAIIFVVTSVSLVRLGNGSVGGGDSVLSNEPAAATPAAPVAPPAPVGDIPTPTATVNTEPVPATTSGANSAPAAAPASSTPAAPEPAKQ
jgi:preprotein translocase subunit SecG